MFYEVNKINDALNCSKCRERLDIPRILPCGEFVCSLCLSAVHVADQQYGCILCDKKHTMPDEGLPISKKLSALISLQPTEVYRGQAAETLKETLSSMRKKAYSLKFSVQNGIEKIKQHCSDLRNDVQLATEEAIDQLNAFNDELIKEIDQFEADCTKLYQSDETTKEEVMKTVKELESFQAEWSKYLKQPRINDQHIANANLEAAKLSEKVEQENINLDCLIFSEKLLKFVKNSSKLEPKVLGSLEIESLKCMDSTIVSSKETTQVMKLCEFSLDQKWKLLYRASQDGYEAEKFHSKCDNQPNTLVIIKSTSGNVFGGYTQRSWEGEGIYRSDPNAFIFSFINKDNKPLLMKCQQQDDAIWCNNECGPVFGNLDISIYSNSNVNDKSEASLGDSYIHPEYEKGSDILAGSIRFSTIEIEVFTTDTKKYLLFSQDQG